MKKYERFIIYIFICIFLFKSIPVFAETIDIVFNSINITVNGVKVEADNILYNGTTYVPLRKIGEMLNKDVGWDESTRTASINDKSDKSDENNKEDKDDEKTSSFILSAGEYIVGVDIQPGKYYLEVISGSGSLHRYDKGSKVYVLTITFGTFDSDLFVKTYNNFRIENKDVIAIKNDVKIQFTKID